MIRFPQRKALIQETQRDLGIHDDGIDGPQTWTTIARNLGIEFNLRPSPSPALFGGRHDLIRLVQDELDIVVDGLDGPQTWAALAQEFDPKPINFPKASPDIPEFSETSRGRTPNRNRGINTCEGIVIHHAAGYFEGTISWCLRPRTFAGYHCLIAPDGTRAILGEDTDRVHHAGTSIWQGRSGCNQFMLGVSFCGDTNSGAMRPGKDLTVQELASLHEWIAQKKAQYGFGNDVITHHRVVSPGRKNDLSLSAWGQIQRLIGKS